MTAEIITIGDEILIGQIVDSNSAWMAEKLNLAGIKVHQISSISDDEIHIINALNEAATRADLVLMTGGLGPTKDDITKKTLCKYFDTKLVLHNDILEDINALFKRRGFPILKENSRQAELPENCTIIRNYHGTASGMWFEKNNTIFVSLPGVPREMEKLMEDGIIPKIKESFELPVIVHRTILTFGFIESELSNLIEDWELGLPKGMKLAYLPSLERLRLRLSISGDNREDLENLIDKEEKKLKEYLGDAIFGYGEQSLQEMVGKILEKENKTLATAESCTGGNIARLITGIPGSSEYFKGAVVAYENSIKEHVLNVSESDLIKFGAVSKEVVEQMALGVKKLMKTDYSIATSGIAGPGGGTEDKPVGTIWIAIAGPDKLISKKYTLGNQREFNIRRTSSVALNKLRKMLIE
ncbi:MAG: competence/damage-inducible protein A [Bacteroidetes bacterium]|nr:MAG: competence/damage-inducible protein A [Bacteroidota bacterium]